MERFKKLLGQVKESWEKWSGAQKLIFSGILVAIVVAVGLIVGLSSSPNMITILGVPITDPLLRDRIVVRLDEEGVNYTLGPDDLFYVEELSVARRMRTLLVREGLVPTNTDPWAIFDVERWTITDYERDINLRRAINENLKQHIESLDDVDSAKVTVVIPEKRGIFSESAPTTASIIITPKPGSDILTNRQKIEGLVQLTKFAIEGLQEENITILDYNSRKLNLGDDLQDYDRFKLTQKMLEEKGQQELAYMDRIIYPLQRVFSKDRVEIINIDVDLDFVDRSITKTEYSPIILQEDNPLTPFYDGQITDSITLSSLTMNEDFEGTGFSPEGPPGAEANTAPDYKDLQNMVGQYSRSSVQANQAVNVEETVENKRPFDFKRISAAVVVDGKWEQELDEEGNLIVENGRIKRKYTPVSEEELAVALDLVQKAIGYDLIRGDSVTVRHMQFDRDEEFRIEDEAFLQKEQRRKLTFWIALGVFGVLALVILGRSVVREMERRRRLKEQEEARQQQLLREQALKDAENSSIEVDMSMEERTRLEMQENAKNIARNDPENVASLIRTWLAEE